MSCPTDSAADSGATAPSLPADQLSPYGFTVYSNGYLTALAPVGWTCHGLLAADGGMNLAIFPADQADPSQPDPSLAAEGVVISLEFNPGVYNICRMIPDAESSAADPCREIPSGESFVNPRSNRADFKDEPGVQGAGTPSGGDYPANGVAIYTTVDGDPSVHTATCTLPEPYHARCTTILRNWAAQHP